MVETNAKMKAKQSKKKKAATEEDYDV